MENDNADRERRAEERLAAFQAETVNYVIASLLEDSRFCRRNIRQHDRDYERNHNFPSSMEHAKNLLYIVHNAKLNIAIPEKPMQSALEIYDYIDGSLYITSKILRALAPARRSQFRDSGEAYMGCDAGAIG